MKSRAPHTCSRLCARVYLKVRIHEAGHTFAAPAQRAAVAENTLAWLERALKVGRRAQRSGLRGHDILLKHTLRLEFSAGTRRSEGVGKSDVTVAAAFLGPATRLQ